MKRRAIIVSFVLIFIIVATTISFLGCKVEKKQYKLGITGSNYLYENLNDTYAAGDEVFVKVKINPYEGVKVLLDNEALVKTKSDQNKYWLFSFTMPDHDAVLDISSFKGFDEPVLYGFYLNFYDKNHEPIESLNKDVDSEDAIAEYAIIYNENGHKIYGSNKGANVFAETSRKVSNISYELETTLYYTYELIDAVLYLDWVYFDENTQKAHLDNNYAGYYLGTNAHFSTSDTQNFSDIRFNSQMEEYEEKFDSYVKINVKYLDYLTCAKVLEYDKDNQLINSTIIEKSDDSITFIASNNCEYVVIEEEYTVMNDEEHNGEKHYERTLISKTKYGNGMNLKFPRGDGLVSPVYLSVKWQSETAE